MWNIREEERKVENKQRKAEWKVEVEAWNKAKAGAKKEAFSLPKPMVRGHLLPPEPKPRVEVEEDDESSEDDADRGSNDSETRVLIR